MLVPSRGFDVGNPYTRDTQQGPGGVRVVASLRLFRRDTGGGCAAAVINQWKRLRRGELLGTDGAMPAWAPALPDLLDCARERSSRPC